MNPIIVGVDGSEESLHAARMAAELALARHVPLVFAFVIPPTTAGGELTAFASAELLSKLEGAAKLTLDRAAQAAQQPAAERVVLMGAPAEELARLADERKAWMLVVGNRGLGLVKRMLVGSVTDRLVHISGRPVLVVR